MFKKISSVCFLIFFCNAYNQELKLEDIMKGDEYVGHQPTSERWSIDGSKIYFEWNPKNELGNSTYFWQNGMAKPEIADDAEATFSKLNWISREVSNTMYYIQNNALFSYQKSDKSNRKIFQNGNPISKVQLGNTPGVVYFVQNENVLKWDQSNASVVQITNFKKGKTREIKAEKESFLKSQQTELFQFIRDQDAKKKWNKSKIKPTDFPKEYWYGDYSLEALKVSPNGNYVTFRLTEEISEKNEKMEVFITSDGYNQSPETKSKVSTANFVKSYFSVYQVAKDSVIRFNFSTLSHLKDVPEYMNLYEKNKIKTQEEKLIIVQEPVFNDAGTYAIAEIRSQDNKDRWLVNLDLEKVTFQEIEYQHDDAWIGGPGIPSYAFSSGTLGFIADDETLYFQSEQTGFSHLYTLNLKTKIKKQLTKGNWEVRKVLLSKDRKSFYLTTNTTHPGNRNFYRVPTLGGVLEPIFTQDGAHEVSLSPDEKSLLVRYSYKNKPWELYVSSNTSNAKLNPITNSTTTAFNAYPWRSPEVVTYKATDGTKIFARIYKPKEGQSNNAAVLFVHGAGYLQNAHNFWSTYMREYMFHNLLVDQGYTVLDIDYRASDGYGRDFRTGIYRFMGGKDLTDQIDGKNYLVTTQGIDPSRVGIYGGSYGGFITLMAMLTAPKEFKSGAALRSVTDWAHYNHGYTGNILNFPETDPLAYKKSSPIYFAENLEGNLLLLHGMVDDNVEYKDIVRLSQRFIELGKKNWSLSSYPVEAHGFKETYSWVDEYGRILNLFNSTLLKN